MQHAAHTAFTRAVPEDPREQLSNEIDWMMGRSCSEAQKGHLAVVPPSAESSQEILAATRLCCCCGWWEKK